MVTIFNEGISPEEIAMQLPALTLSHIYQTIGYYLAHRDEVDAYVAAAEKHSQQVYAENQTRFSSSELRKRLLRRKRESE